MLVVFNCSQCNTSSDAASIASEERNFCFNGLFDCISALLSEAKIYIYMHQ